ncbi:CopM family metallochaperone [Acidisoma cladoniae]|jgi:uncharacterized protein (DUF305 family)|uniref:CopM family metallochaperone n=1 Tax=Acidisoma cladoniae TaxID=3040935 RepID=UPI00254C4983|nr:DUF305 domain-containing protein [Acidisoma sp. PAMC 29798]
MKLLTTLAVLALAASPSVAMAQAMNMGANASPADKAFMSSMQTMMKNMDVKPTGNTDKDFVSMMMPHHQGAIDMAKVELEYGKDPMLRKMAADIVTAQEKEIGEMKSWQAKNTE